MFGTELKLGQPTGINTMQIVEVWREAESLNGALDILLNMGSRVSNSAESTTIIPHAIKAAF